jgi:hypothetical protein
MIGYTISKSGTRSDFEVSGSNTIVCVQNTGEAGMTLSPGVWMVTVFSTMGNTAFAGTLNFATTGMSTSRTVYTDGTGARSVCGTSSIPSNATASRILGSFATTIVVPSSTEYFQLVNASYTGSSFIVTCFAAFCFMTATRIA